MDPSPLKIVLRELGAILDKQDAAGSEAAPLIADRLQSLRTAVDATAQEITTVMQAWGEHSAVLRAQLAEVEELLNRGVGDVEEAQARVETLESSLAEQNASLSAAEARAADLERLLGDTQASGAAAHARIEQLEKNLSEVQTAAAGYQRRLGELEAELSARSQEGAGREKEQALLIETNESLQIELAAARSEIHQLETEKAAWSAAQGETEELRQRVATISEEQEERLTQTTEALRRAEEEAAAIRAQLAGAPTPETLSALRAQYQEERVRAELAEQRLRDEVAKGTKSVLAQQLTEALRDAEDARDQVRTLTMELERARHVQSNNPTPMSDEQRVLNAAKTHGNHGKRALGEILLDAGIITAAQLEQSLEEQRKNATRHLGEILVAHHFASDAAVAQAMACQCGVEFIRLTETQVDPEAAALISERLAAQHACLPIAATQDSLVLAIANPMDLLAIEDVERATNRKVSVVVAALREIKDAINRYYWEPE